MNLHAPSARPGADVSRVPDREPGPMHAGTVRRTGRSRPRRRLALVIPLGLLMACVAQNPAYDPMGSQEVETTASGGQQTSSSPQPSGSTSTGEAAETAGETSGGNASSGGDTEPPTTGPVSSTDGQDSSGGAVDETAGTGGAAVTLEPSQLGQSCGQRDGCSELGPDVECCEANQCQGTCMVACEDAAECPFEGMGCEHGYCLFPCGDELGGGDEGGDDDDGGDDGGDNDPDADCAPWPGFTCQHGMRFCEND